MNILKIKKAFPTLLNKKIIKIHEVVTSKPGHKSKKIQSTTKGPSRKQAIVPVSNNLINVIIEEANTHIFYINNKVFIQASGLACEVYVEVSLLCSLPTMVCEVADSVVCQVAILSSFNSLWG